jgi:hypothetical protein
VPHSGSFTDGHHLHELLFSIEENDSERFAIEKTHFGTKLGDGQRIIDGELLTFLPEGDGAQTERANQAKGFGAG